MTKEIFKLSSDFVLYKSDSEEGLFLLFNVNTGTNYRLNKVAYSMIELIDGVRSTEDILQILFGKYQASHDELKNDFNDLLKKWIDNNIITAITDTNK